MPTVQENARTLLDKVIAVGDDISTLDVVTLTGDVPLTLAAGGSLDPTTLFNTLNAQITAGAAGFKLLALTHKEPDYDAVVFVKSGLTDEEKSLLSVHDAMVKTSEEARLGVLKLLASIIGLKPTP